MDTSALTDSASASFARSSRLVRYLAIAYLGLVAYASLYPFSGWLAPSIQVRDLLTAPWPRYLTVADVSLNVLAYLPLGLLLALALMPRMPRWLAAVVAAAAGVVLSFSIEAAQIYLPGRVPSNVDLLCNAIGAAVGAAIAAGLGERWLLSGELYRVRRRLFHHGTAVDFGFLLLTLWLITQLNGEIWLFGNGDIRHLIPGTAAIGYSARGYPFFEAGVAALNLAGVALLLTAMSRSPVAAIASVAGLVGLALVLKTLAAAALFVPGNPLLWVTPGSVWGLLAGAALWAVLALAPKALQLAVAAMLLALATALVNAAPENPYLSAILQVWQHGHFASLNQLTRMLSSAWSFLAIAYLVYAGFRLR